MNKPTVSMQLPCVVKLPLKQYLDTSQAGFCKTYEIHLEAARNTEAALSGGDLIVSCGYDRLTAYKQILSRDYFNPLAGARHLVHPAFRGWSIDDERFGLLGAISLVWVVDQDKMGALPLPRTWLDLCREELKGKVAYTADANLMEDLIRPFFSARFSPEEVDRFQAALTVGLHPSEMMRKGRHRGQEAIFLMPYFFASMKAMEPGMKLVWPEDGALSLPIFVTAKQAGRTFAKLFEEPDFILAFSAQGKFPSALMPASLPVPGSLIFREPDLKEVG